MILVHVFIKLFINSSNKGKLFLLSSNILTILLTKLSIRVLISSFLSSLISGFSLTSKGIRFNKVSFLPKLGSI